MFSRSRYPLLTFLWSYHVWVTSKIQVNFRYRRYSKVLMILSYKFLKFLQYSCFRGQEIYCWHSYWATMFGWPRKSRSTPGTGGTRRYWWFCLINFWNFFSIHVSEVKKSIADIPTGLTRSGDLKNPGQLPVQEVLMILSYEFLKFFSIFMFSRSRNPMLAFLLSNPVRVTSKIQVNFRYRGTRRYWWLCLMNFWHFFTIYVSEVKQPNFDISTELPCLGDLKHPGHFQLTLGRLGGVDATPLAFFPCNFFDDSIAKNRLIVSVTRDGRHILAYVTSSWRCHVTYVMTSYVVKIHCFYHCLLIEISFDVDVIKQ